MEKCKIFIPRGKRSNWGLIEPIINKLFNNKLFSVYNESTNNGLPSIEFDIGLICADRKEMLEYALRCFEGHIPIAHLYAGVLNSMATRDDIYRHMITLMSDIQFCESYESYVSVISLCNSVDKKPNAHIVGITHLEDLKISYDISSEMGVPFDLVLYNPIDDKEQQKKDIRKIEGLIHDKIVITIGNPDENIEIKTNVCSHTHYNNLDRDQFLGLLNKCERFISNSSIVYYEAPFLMKTPSEIIQIGNRNDNRSTKNSMFETKGVSKKIMEIIEKWWIDKNG